MKNKKIIILALVLLIIAGIIVFAIKGFNVDFMLKQHDSIEYTISKNFEISDIENIAKEVFGEKKFKIRVIELFDDAISIHAEQIQTDEAESLIKKLDEKYKNTSEEQNKENNESAQNIQETEKTENENTNSTDNTGNEVETQPEESLENSLTDYTIISNPKIKLLSLIKPYIIPSIIAGIIILLYEGFRYKKLGVVKTLFNLIMLVLISVLSLLSIIVITRFPINIYVCPIIFVLVLIEIILFNIKQEKELGKLNDEE